ncbi:ATP-binding cassette, subfamily B, MsbA [Abditibacterium utsteinense]|uniref:ATP-binding cassette, subfamily B, MsbA n=1 Tax=Abditibacterium utsteinense TaxID=1960156 RepID=A0A2S8SX22_9BACT|nr:ABC transporter ATP-binding protein [Abditibacterium utsteinense]PQV65351.1 ATP-binding cassette, subfamily B, MsbA [Abditibacterium utsteinense]
MENLKRLLPYIKPHKSAILLGLFCTVLSSLLGGAFIWLAQRVLESVLDPAMPDRLTKLNFFILAVMAQNILLVFASYGQTYVVQRTGQRILARLREDLFAHFGTLSISFFERKRTGEVMSRLTNDIGSLQQVLTQAVTTAIGAPISMVIYLFFMLHSNWKLSLFVIVILPPVALLINRAGRKIRAAVKHLQIQNANLTDYLQEKVSAMRLIQTFGTQAHENQAFKRVNQSAYRSTMTPIRIQASLAPIIDFIGMSGVMLTLWFGAQTVHTAKEASALVTFIFVVHRTAMTAKSLASLNLMFKSADAAASRLWEIFDTPPEVKDSPNAIELQKMKVNGHLQFENVRFSYVDDTDVLHDISFEIKPGEVVALAGLSGSGKSTIAALLPRLYDPTGGKITLDGTDLRDVQLQSLRDLIGAVPQDVTLFHGTLRDNIAYGTPDATLEQVMEAARRAHADEFIRKLPQGYDAPIGERGGGFSGGQKQRLAIARALLRDPKLLILDEATSALDAESEGLVQDALTELMKGRTTLIIAHRFSTIVHADRILVLDQGRVIESGSHAELLAARGQYFRLYQMQSFQAKRGDEEVPETQSVAVDAPVLAA